ncbi:hypothetical protein ACVWW9_002098 [Agrococcus sp. UYP33]
MDRTKLLPKYPDLKELLEDIERETIRWWETPHLWWYTDHTHAHSQRVAEMCDSFVDVRSLPDNVALSTVERVILEAAAWVHDLGMQGSAPPLNEEAQEAVRRAHPARTRDLITGGAFNHLIRDTTLSDAISEVAKAHGSDYYEAVVAALPAIRQVKGEKVRLRLLAALLLMADELDLRNERALKPRTDASLPAVSAAHWLKHRCISGVELVVTSVGSIEIHLEMTQLADVDDGLAAQIREWVTSKLRMQIALTEPQVKEGFNGHFVFDRNVRWTVFSSANSSELVTDDVRAVIASEIDACRLVNHASTVRDAVGAGQLVQIVGGLNVSGGDRDGREDVSRRVVSRLAAAGAAVLEYSAMGLMIEATAASVIYAWCDLAGENSESVDVAADLDGETQANEGLGRLLGWQAQQSGPVVLVLSGWDRLAHPQQAWFQTVAIPALASHTATRLIFTTSLERLVEPVGLTCDTVHVHALTDEAKLRYVSRYIEATAADTVVPTLDDYLSTRRYALRREQATITGRGM